MLLAADIDALAAPDPAGWRSPATGPGSPTYNSPKDRETLLPDREQRRQLWRPVGGPGLVLVDGHAAGIWTSRRNGKTLSVTVDPFSRPSRTARRAISDEAESIAALRGADRISLAIAG